MMVDRAEPIPRFWHHGFLHSGQIYLRGGRTPHFPSERGQLSSTLEQFEPTKEVWQQIDTEGTPHPGLTQAASVCVGDVLYVYGGDGKVLSQLDMRSLLWSELWSTSELDNGETPMIKDACGIVAFGDGHLGVFGGYASRSGSGPLQHGSRFDRNKYGDENEGWTNEFHLFNIKKKIWMSPTIEGTRPPPTCDFTLNSISDLKAILFGGFQDNGFQDELYVIEFNASKMEIKFTKVEKKHPWPEGRESHAACCLGLDTDRPQLLISGGKNMYDHVLKFDTWMLDIVSLVWKRVRLPGGQRVARWGHSMTAVFVCLGLEAVVIFGGSPEDFGKQWRTPEFKRLADTAILYFGNLGSEWILMEERVKAGDSPFFSNRTLSKSELTPYELDSQFSMRLIFTMEKAYGIPLLSELAKKNQEFQQLIQVRQPDASSAITRWLSAAANPNKKRPTWRNLSMVLHEIGLGPLARQMEDVLIERAIATTSTLKGDLASHYGKELGKGEPGEGDYVRQRILAFARNSEATISMLKRKYDELRIDFEQLELRCNTASVPSTTEQLKGVATSAAQLKDEAATMVSVARQRVPSTGPVQIPQGGEEYWKQQFHSLSDKSDSTIKLLKKENRRLRGKVESLEDANVGHSKSIAVIKTEPMEVDVLADIPQSSASSSVAGQISSDVMESKVNEEENVKQSSSQLLAGHADSAIQILEAQNEELRDEIESLRCQLELQQLNTEQRVNGNVNGSTSASIAETKSNVGDSKWCGVDICEETTLEITNLSQPFKWKEFGLELDVSEGTLPEGIDKCTVKIKASTSGHYQFPDDIHLVSAIILLNCQPKCKFAKPITMRLDHCAKSANTSQLSFMRAHRMQGTLPYVFKKLEGGQFTNDSRIGSIQLTGFCQIGVGEEDQNTKDHSCQREYVSSIFQIVDESTISYYCLKVDFVFTWNTKAHRTAVKKEYDGRKPQLEMAVEFESDSIYVDIPLDSSAVEGSWKISSLIPPVVLKRLVDSYDKGKMIPRCQFSAKIFFREGERVPWFQHQVNLKGAKSPYNMLMLEIAPPEISPAKKRSLSESDRESLPEAKRPRSELVRKSHSLDSKMAMGTIAEVSDVSSAYPSDEFATYLSDLSKPNMANLTLFKWKDATSGEVKRFRLKSQIAHRWRNIGDLVTTFGQLQVWSSDLKDSSLCCSAVLDHWLNHPPPNYPATWKGLVELLEDSELSTCAAELEKALKAAT